LVVLILQNEMNITGLGESHPESSPQFCELGEIPVLRISRSSLGIRSGPRQERIISRRISEVNAYVPALHQGSAVGNTLAVVVVVVIASN
jgi:hypothetical protein